MYIGAKLYHKTFGIIWEIIRIDGEAATLILRKEGGGYGKVSVNKTTIDDHIDNLGISSQWREFIWLNFKDYYKKLL